MVKIRPGPLEKSLIRELMKRPDDEYLFKQLMLLQYGERAVMMGLMNNG